MGELVEVELPDGRIIWARISEEGPSDVGWSDRAKSLRGLPETVEAIAANVHRGLAKARPDEVAVEFSLEFAAGRDGLVAALCGVSANATVKVTLTWDTSSQPAEEPDGAAKAD